MAVDDPRVAPAQGEPDDDADSTTLAARVEVLAEENARLRREYARARRSEYRRSALGLALVGLVAAGGGLLFPDARAVLFALAGTGGFGAVLVYYLTPERFVAATVGERIYEALASTGTALTTELGLRADRLYVPTPDHPDRSVTLFVPQHEAYELPPADTLGDLLVVPGADAQRGLAVRPTGDALLAEFEATLTAPLAESPAGLAEQLADGLVEQFELAASAFPEADPTGNRVTVAVTDSAFGAVDRFDHPIASFVAVGLARGLDAPVELDVTPADDDRADYLITCTWDEARLPE